MNIYDDPSRAEETRMLLQAAIESANDAIIITEYQLDDPGPRIEYVNPAFTRMTQYSQSEVIGQTPRILQGPKTSRELLVRLREDLKTGSSFHGQTTNYRKDGAEYEVEWRITPVIDRSGKPIKWLAVQRDVTERVQAEAALQESEKQLRLANQDLEQFVFAASHDLQEPIRNVSLHGQFIQRSMGETIPEVLNEHLGYVIEGSKRLGLLISDLLAYARASHIDDADQSTTDLNVVIDVVERDLARMIAETGASIERYPLPRVRMPQTQLQQIYLNLITNSIKYRKPDATPQITIGTQESDTPEYVGLFVQDNGIGVDPRFHAEIFGVFKRLNKDDGGGTGIGLAIVQRLIERSGGSVWIESDGRSGTRISFTLPKGTRHSADAS